MDIKDFKDYHAWKNKLAELKAPKIETTEDMTDKFRLKNYKFDKYVDKSDLKC